LVAAASATGACLLRVPVSRNSLNSVSGLATEDLNWASLRQTQRRGSGGAASQTQRSGSAWQFS
jgi:hypothetical protein